jgi:hypothetical protein
LLFNRLAFSEQIDLLLTASLSLFFLLDGLQVLDLNPRFVSRIFATGKTKPAFSLIFPNGNVTPLTSGFQEHNARGQLAFQMVTFNIFRWDIQLRRKRLQGDATIVGTFLQPAIQLGDLLFFQPDACLTIITGGHFLENFVTPLAVHYRASHISFLS